MREISFAEIKSVTGGVTGYGVCVGLVSLYTGDVFAAVGGALTSETGPGAIAVGMVSFSLGSWIGQEAGSHLCS